MLRGAIESQMNVVGVIFQVPHYTKCFSVGFRIHFVIFGPSFWLSEFVSKIKEDYAHNLLVIKTFWVLKPS